MHFAFGIGIGIVNGDITEFGRVATRNSFDTIYSQKLQTKILLGLGNHDYANNVNDCMEPDYFDFSKNACARGAFFDVIKRMEGYSKFLARYSDDFERSQQQGSGAYSWDQGDIHYVQLHNYPTYQVVLDHYVNKAIYVKKSLDWLEDDLRNAFARGKSTVLNLHDAYDHIAAETTHQEKQRLRQMVNDYNVMAVFSGHSHHAGESASGFFGALRHFNSGALYNGDFLVAEVQGKCMTVSRYQGDSGEATLMANYPVVCGK